MPRLTALPTRRRAALLAGVLALAALGAACAPEPPPPPPPPPEVCDPPAGSNVFALAVMGPCFRVTVEQVATWFESKPRPAYRAQVPVRDLVRLYLEEGQAENVRGDLAFIQAIIETGWFSYGGRVPPEANNYAGIGATDGTTGYAVFPSARIGVRAHIQHLRAYADPTATTCTVPPLANPCASPRFHLVVPKGKAPTWNHFGNGNWATDPGYAVKMLNLYADLLDRYGVQPFA